MTAKIKVRFQLISQNEGTLVPTKPGIFLSASLDLDFYFAGHQPKQPLPMPFEQYVLPPVERLL